MMTRDELEELYPSIARIARSVCRARSCPNFAEAAAARCRLKACENCSDLEKERVHGWCHTVITNDVKNLQRSAALEKDRMEATYWAIQERTRPVSPSARAEQEEQQTVLRRCVAELKPVYRLIVSLELAGCNQKRISDITTIAKTTVNESRKKALESLAKCLADKDLL